MDHAVLHAKLQFRFLGLGDAHQLQRRDAVKDIAVFDSGVALQHREKRVQFLQILRKGQCAKADKEGIPALLHRRPKLTRGSVIFDTSAVVDGIVGGKRLVFAAFRGAVAPEKAVFGGRARKRIPCIPEGDLKGQAVVILL